MKSRLFFFKLFALFLALSVARWYWNFPDLLAKPLHWSALISLLLTALPWPGWPLHWIWLQIQSKLSESVRFFAGMGAVLIAAAVYQAFFRSSPAALLLGSMGLICWIVAMLSPAAAAIFAVWMKAAHAIQFVVSRVLLTIVYVIAVVPVGLAARLVGKRFLQKQIDPAGQSYWINRDKPATLESYRRHF